MCALSSLTLHAARRGHASLRPCVFVPRPWDCRTCWSWACRDNCLSQACLQKAPMARPSAGSCLKHRWSRGKKVRKSTENDEVSERMRAGSQAGRHVFYVVLVFCFAFLCKDQQARVPITSLSLRSSWYRTKLMLMWKLALLLCGPRPCWLWCWRAQAVFRVSFATWSLVSGEPSVPVRLSWLCSVSLFLAD